MADEETATEEVEETDAAEASAEATEETADAEAQPAESDAAADDAPPAEGDASDGQAEATEAAEEEIEAPFDIDAVVSGGAGVEAAGGGTDAPFDIDAVATGGSGNVAADLASLAALVADPEVSDEIRRILRLEVPVIVKLADKKLPLGDIIDLSPGSIVEFSRSADTPLELLVNNKTIGSGVAVKVGEKFGLRIDELLSVEETIRKLGV